MVEPGEERKTLAAAEEVLRALARGGAERGDLVVAVGGGVVGDLAGFCAAVYQRGMRHVQVPTTLVAQVDSAYGGKTGVDLPEGKNYAGAYHQPSAVLVRPGRARPRCPRAELAAGYAEVVKTALIAGGAALGARAPGRRARPRDRDRLRPDEARGGGRGRARRRPPAGAEPRPHRGSRDRGRHRATRATATARPWASGCWRRCASPAGMRCAPRWPSCWRRAGCRRAFDGAGVDEVVALVERDKKRIGGRVPFVLVEAPGEVTPGHDVEPADLRAAVEEVHEG